MLPRAVRWRPFISNVGVWTRSYSRWIIQCWHRRHKTRQEHTDPVSHRLRGPTGDRWVRRQIMDCILILTFWWPVGRNIRVRAVATILPKQAANWWTSYFCDFLVIGLSLHVVNPWQTLAQFSLVKRGGIGVTVIGVYLNELPILQWRFHNL